MSHTEIRPPRSEPLPLPANIASVQPGGGVCYRLELAWGAARRWYLRTFRPGYVRRMAALRQGDTRGCPHDVLDPRDLKYCRNQCTAWWSPADDPFAWRDALPFARWGLAELQIMGYPLFAATVLAASTRYWYLSIVPGVLLALVVYFFRDPRRLIPRQAEVLVAPADGKVCEITRLPVDEFLGGPAVRIGIFLSIFNVHINRAPAAARVIELRYSPGKFLNALDPRSAVENESMWIGLEEQGGHGRRYVVRQIAGQFARRIVCALRSGELLTRGQQFGMIKLGSRTELIVPDEPGLRIETRVGQRIRAGTSVLARYETDAAASD